MITKIGKHKVMCSDIMLTDINLLLQGVKVDMMYSDPPWGEGNLKFWQTMNTKMTFAERNDTTLDLFLNRIFTIAKNHVQGLVFMEYGVRWNSMIKAMINMYGFKDLATIPLKYRGGAKLLPLDFHIFAPEFVKLDQPYLDSISGTHGYTTLERVFALPDLAGKTILDPCCGMGYTAQAAVDNGMIFYGNELNEARLSKTIKRLS